MPIRNHSLAPLTTAGTKHQLTNVRFTTNAGSAVVASSVTGGYVQSVARTAVGTYLVTLANFSPRDMVSCEIREVSMNFRVARLGQVTIAPATRTVTIVVYTHAFAAGGPADVGVADVRAAFHWKLFPAQDSTGL